MATTNVMYDGKRLIPAPFVSVNKTYQRTADQTPVGAVFRITVTGSIVAYMGSPKVDGSFWTLSDYPPDESVPAESRLKAMLRKQEAIRDLFSNDGYVFEIQSADGSQPMKCNPRVVDITFADGLWYDTLPYTIVLESDTLSVNGQPVDEDDFSDFITDASESWNIETDETPEGIGLPRTYRLTHSVSATGKRYFDETGTLVKDAWEQAQSYVLGRLGYSAVVATSSGINNLPDYYGGYNFSRTSQQDELNGTYAVTESWILASGTALEDFNCEIKNDSSTGITGVTIQGNIIGLEQRDSNMSLVTKKFTNAETKWAAVQSSLLTRAQTYAGVTLNPIALNKVVGKNDINGTITYSYDYDTRPSNLFSGTTYEGITISENRPADLFASIPVIGRAAGPVLQNLGSQQERSVSLNIELIMAPTTFGSGTAAELRTALYGNPRVSQGAVFDTVLAAAQPLNYYGTTNQFVRSQQESWDVKSGRYSYNIEWVFGN